MVDGTVHMADSIVRKVNRIFHMVDGICSSCYAYQVSLLRVGCEVKYVELLRLETLEM